MNKTEILKHICIKRKLFDEPIIPEEMLNDVYDIVNDLNDALGRISTERDLAKSIEDMSDNWMSRPE